MQVTTYHGSASNQDYTPSASFLFGLNWRYSLHSGCDWTDNKINNTTIMLNPCSALLPNQSAPNTVILVSVESRYLSIPAPNQPAPFPSQHLIHQLELPSCSAAMWLDTLPGSFCPSSLMTESFTRTKNRVTVTILPTGSSKLQIWIVLSHSGGESNWYQSVVEISPSAALQYTLSISSFVQLYTSTPPHFRGRYCTFYPTGFIWQLR